MLSNGNLTAQSSAIVGNETGQLLYKDVDGQFYFNGGISSAVNGTRKYKQILKWILDRKEKMGFTLKADIESYVEDFEPICIPQTFFEWEGHSLNAGEESFTVRGTMEGRTSELKTDIHRVDWMSFAIKDIVNFPQQLYIYLEYSIDSGATWQLYSKFRAYYEMEDHSDGVEGPDKRIKINKPVECPNRTFMYRFKFVGDGYVHCKEEYGWFVSAGGQKIINDKFIPYTEEKLDLSVVSYDENEIVFNGPFTHTKGLVEKVGGYKKRNSRQHLKLFLEKEGEPRRAILDEVYTDNFIDKINLLPKDESSYMLFCEDDMSVPTINLNPKIKQLLYKYENVYVNKPVIERDCKLNEFGFKVVKNIDVYSSENAHLNDSINSEKITIRNSKNIKFNGIELNQDDEKLIGIFDVSGKLISPGNAYFATDNKLNEVEVMDKIKKWKTFKKATVILYDEYNEKIQNLIDVLSSCSKTPETVFLCCTVPNSSSEYVIDKISYGNLGFYNTLIKSIKNRVGLQFTGTNTLVEQISTYIGDKITLGVMKSCSNLVGINIYNFSKATVDKDEVSSFGYYINEVVDDIKIIDKINFLNVSSHNSLKNVVQYDIGSKFEVEFDLKGVVDGLNIEMFNEDKNFPGKDKPYYNISIKHNENIMFTYINGNTIKVIPNPDFEKTYTLGINDGVIKLQGKEALTSEDRGDNALIVEIKRNDAIIGSCIAKCIVDYPEPSIDKFYLKATDKINEVGYKGFSETCYTKDNFIEVGLNLNSVYEFLEDEYEILIQHKKDKDYKIVKKLEGELTSKIFTFHIDDIKDSNDSKKKIKFGEWECKLIRKKYDLSIADDNLDIELHLKEAIVISAVPVDMDFDDFENNGLQQGKDVYLKLNIINSNYFKTIKDVLTYVKEVRFISNNINFTGKRNFFTYLDESGTGVEHSLDYVTSHDKNNVLDKRSELRWFISGSTEGDTTRYLNPISNLAKESKKSKNIKIDLVLFTGEIIETPTVVIGVTGKVPEPIILGSSEHLDKLKMMHAKKTKKTVDSITKEELVEIKKEWIELGKPNYKNQQIINQAKTFAFYSNLLEFKLDFGICEYYTISQANNTTDLIPITKDGVIRYILDENGIDEFGKGIVTIKSFIKLSDGKINSSAEVLVHFYRKKFPSMVLAGDDYTKYVFYSKNSDSDYTLKTVIQSQLNLENLKGTYDSARIDHIEVELVDVDKRTIIATGPIVKFYDGFVPQKFIFDNGLTDEDKKSLDKDERALLKDTKKYKELEKILNEKIFSQGKHLGETFYLRFKAVEKIENTYGETVGVNGKETFYPIVFTERLKELEIVPSNGIIVLDEGLFTYKNKVTLMLESNNAEYFMYRTDRSASFQKVYPKSVGYSKLLKIVVSTYDVGNHFLEVKQKAEGETESNVYSVIVEKIEPALPPKISGETIVDENPKWILHPSENSTQVETEIVTGDSEHSKKLRHSLPYEVTIEPDSYLEIGYHALKAIAYDKIGNGSIPTYFLTKKIGRPVASTIEGIDKTSNGVIKWEWKSQYNEGVVEYLAEVNGIEKYSIPANRTGFNEFNMRFFQGKEISDGTFELRLWAINELGNKNYMYSSYITEKGSKITDINISMYKFKDDYTNKLEAFITSDDKAMKSAEYEILKNNNGIFESVTGILKTESKKIPFINKSGDFIKLEDGQYMLAVRGINHIDEKTEFCKIPFIFKTSLPKKPYIFYPKIIKKRNPVIFVKTAVGEQILSIEVKIGEKAYEKVRNNVWRPNYSIPTGISNIVIRVTDFAGNQSEFSDFVEVNKNGVNFFQGDFVADMRNPILDFDFHLREMNIFGHSDFLIENKELDISTIVNIENVNSIKLPLKSSEGTDYPNGVYTFAVKVYDDLTKDYDYILDLFYVTINNNKPKKPYFLNSGYSSVEFDKAYTQNRTPNWIWQTRQDVSEIKEYVLTLLEYNSEDKKFYDYGIGQFKEHSNKYSNQFQVPGNLKDGTYKLELSVLGSNGLYSEQTSFTFVVKNSLPNPPLFDIKDRINRKYENRNTGIMWRWKDTNRNENVFIGYKIKINDEEFSEEFSADKNYYIEKRKLKDGPNTIYVIGKDKAGNWSTANDVTAGILGANYLSNTKILDTSVPNKVDENNIKVVTQDFQTVEVFFENDKKDDDYFIFELYTNAQSGERVTLAKGNTLDKSFLETVFLREDKVIPGISLGEANGKSGYCKINKNSETTEDASLLFTNLLPNKYILNINGVDYSGNVSPGLERVIELKDVTSMKPVFTSPKTFNTNNSTLAFQWYLNADNINRWEYQLRTPYNRSSVDLVNKNKWKELKDSEFILNNIPKSIAGNKADGDYTLYVRAIFDDAVDQAGTGVVLNRKSDIGQVTVTLDRTIPQGVIFTNKKYTNDNSALNWKWEYTGDGDSAAGVYYSFNPNIPIGEWTKLESVKELSSLDERKDGIYTIYMKIFDTAGNIRDEIYSNSIILDREPPFKPMIDGGTNIFTNAIPTIHWENDINYFKYAWLILKENDFIKLNNLYKELISVENYKLTEEDWNMLFVEKDIDEEKVHEKIKKLIGEISIKKNPTIFEDSITVNKSANKNGISDDGKYVFVLAGFDQNNNWAEEYEYQFITYDTEAPDLSKMRFTRPLYTITENRRPEWIWEVPNDVVKCEYNLEKNGYADGSTFGKIENVVETNTAEYKFKPQFNLTSGNYKLVVDCYDASGNHVQINKSITIETESSSLESTFEDIMLEGQSNRVRIKRNKYSNSYVIIDIDIDKNSILSYKESEKEGYNIYELGKTELRLDKEYEFNIISYTIQ